MNFSLISRNVSKTICIIGIFVLILSCSKAKKADFYFVNVKGEVIEAATGIDVTDPIMIRMANLEPSSFYRVRLLDTNGERVHGEDLVFISGGDGTLPDAPVIFLGDETNGIISTKLSSEPGGNNSLAGLKRTIEPGEWCVNVYEFRGSSVTGKRCLSVTDTSKRVYATDSSGNSGKSFLINVGNVYVKGENFTPNSDVNAYLIKNSSSFLTDGDELVDIRGLNGMNFTVNESGIFEGVFWETPSDLGLYDIVIDVDKNGLWNEAADVITGKGFIPGFAVQNKSVSTFKNSTQIACGEAGSNYCVHKDLFIDEDVNVYLKSITQPTGSFDTPAPKIYITPHKDTWTAGDELVSIFETIMNYPVQTGTYAGAKVLAYPKENFTPGCYDVVVDANSNGRYDLGDDFIDSSSIDSSAPCGFNIPGEEGAPVISINTIKDGNDAQVADGGTTTSTTLSLDGTVTASSDIIASYVIVETATQFSKLSFTPVGGAFSTGYFPLFNGANKVTIYFMDTEKRTQYSRVNINSDQSGISRDIEIEMRWSIPEGTTNYDLDLHLVKPGGDYFGGQDTFGIEEDCYWSTCRIEDYPNGIDWGADGGDGYSANNPKLEVDCVSNCVRVENTYIEEIFKSGTYKIYVDAFNGQGSPTVKIYISGLLVSELTPSCNSGKLESGTDYDSWYVGDITFPGSVITFTSQNTCFKP